MNRLEHLNRIEQVQSLRLLQLQIQSQEILAMNTCELKAFLDNMFCENPMIDQTGTNPEPMCVDLLGSTRYRGETTDGDEDRDPFQQMPDNQPLSLGDHLKAQLSPDDLTPIQFALIDYLVADIDDDGLYRYSPESVAAQLNVSAEDVSVCLERLRRLEPIGIFSASMSECLYRQVDVLFPEEIETLGPLIRDHLDELLLKNYRVLSRVAGLSRERIDHCLRLLSRLNPRPRRGFDRHETQYIVPDAVIRDNRGSLLINDSWTGNYTLQAEYMQLLRGPLDDSERSYLEDHLQRAQGILAALSYRHRTLEMILLSILRYQHAYLIGGAPLPAPMTMTAIAADAHVAVSTVSRCVRQKHIQFSRGVISLSSLFSGSAYRGEAGVFSDRDVKLVIGELVAAEDKANPYSDETLRQLLKDHDMTVSRRVISKYRQEMGIADSFRRRMI